jgi:hypothetical protein
MRRAPSGVPVMRIVADGLTPIDTAITHKKVAFAPLGTPNRWREGHRAVRVFPHAPTGLHLLQQIELNRLSTSARADERGGPQILTFAREVHSGR